MFTANAMERTVGAVVSINAAEIAPVGKNKSTITALKHTSIPPNDWAHKPAPINGKQPINAKAMVK